MIYRVTVSLTETRHETPFHFDEPVDFVFQAETPEEARDKTDHLIGMFKGEAHIETFHRKANKIVKDWYNVNNEMFSLYELSA